MNLLAYRRVSTDRQADEGYGLTVQAAALQAFASTAGHRIVATYTDAGMSGELPPEERPGLTRLIDHLDHGDGLGVVIPRLDRLARTLMVQEATLARIWQTGATIYTADTRTELTPDDPDDPMRTAMRQMAGVFAQLDRAQITARMRAGRRVKREGGGYAGDGPPPFGYRAEAGVLVPDPAEQAAIARARELRAMGLSLRAIAESLAIEGHHPKRADRFAPKVLASILRREEVSA